MTRWLVTGAGGMLGRELLRTLDGRSGDSAPVSDGTRSTSPTRRRCTTRWRATTWCSTAAAWTDVDGAETDEAAATRVKRNRRRGAGAGLRGTRRAPGARVRPTTSSPATPPRPTPRTRRPPGQRVRPQQARRRVGRCCEPLPDNGYVVRDRLAVRRARAQLRRHDAAPGRRAATPSTSSTTSAASPPGRSRVAEQLVRLWAAAASPARPSRRVTTAPRAARRPGSGCPGRPSKRPAEPRPGPSDHQRHVRAAGRRPAFSVLGHGPLGRGPVLAPLPHWRTMLSSARPAHLTRVSAIGTSVPGPRTDRHGSKTRVRL
jgi:dTDP-4-dehydrorhamnose reductase